LDVFFVLFNYNILSFFLIIYFYLYLSNTYLTLLILTAFLIYFYIF
jgi:hypothetical protein